MKPVDVLLHPATLFLLGLLAAILAFFVFHQHYLWKRIGVDGFCGGLFVFGGLALVAAVIRRGQLND